MNLAFPSQKTQTAAVPCGMPRVSPSSGVISLRRNVLDVVCAWSLLSRVLKKPFILFTLDVQL